jgi:hypothetical protein
MSVTMRILQQFDPAQERIFLELEKKFAQLEASRKDYPKGRRMKPIAAEQPCNTLVWECEFDDLNAARQALSFFEGDSDHETLFCQQVPYFKQVKIEFYENLDY